MSSTAPTRNYATPPREFSTPFSQAIPETTIPNTFTGPKVTFTGMEDLEVHLTAFHTQMMLVLVDQGSSPDVMFWLTFNKLELSPDLLRPYTGCLYGFADNPVEVRGYSELRTTFTDGAASRTESIWYLVVNANSAYNLFLGRPALNKLRAMSSTRHMKMKLPDLGGKVIVIKSDQEEARKCYENSLKTRRGVVMVIERPLVSNSQMELEPS